MINDKYKPINYFYCVYFVIYIVYMISQFLIDLYESLYYWFNKFTCDKNETLVNDCEYFNYADIYKKKCERKDK